MRIYDIIAKKRDKKILSKEEIEFFVSGFTNGEIPDYQAASLLMAICINGMNVEETVNLTRAMALSGDTADLSKISGVKVDKHSTGGVGDKTTLIVAPLVACFDVPVAKMSGRGLGHTGGTIDKLESIEGFNIALSIDDFVNNVNKIKIAVAGQTGNLVPADKKMYALRDVTATVESIPLIAASIMSKKIAGGADAIVLDVKCGNGAFMKNLQDATNLAKLMTLIGTGVNRKTVAIISNMNEPLGNAIGNSLEVIEAVNTLQGNGPKDLEEICIELAANMINLAGKGEVDEIKDKLREMIKNGTAFNKFREFIIAQGGNIEQIDNLKLLPTATNKIEVKADKKGFISNIDTEKLGVANVLLGGGRLKKGDIIDYSVGIIIHKKVGDFVEPNDSIATIYANDLSKINEVCDVVSTAYEYSDKEVYKQKLIYDIVR